MSTGPEATNASALLTIQQVAELLSCSTRHIRRLVDRGAGPAGQPAALAALGC